MSDSKNEYVSESRICIEKLELEIEQERGAIASLRLDIKIHDLNITQQQITLARMKERIKEM